MLTELVPTRSLAWIALLDLSTEGNRDVGFGGVYHLWILHKICRQGGIVLPHLRAGRKTYRLLYHVNLMVLMVTAVPSRSKNEIL